ncbi:MAG: T9SS type A sorting domain-containing protein, partial [Bacteroidota bacterium]
PAIHACGAACPSMRIRSAKSSRWGELYPNPSSTSATLAVQVAESQEASVTVYDVLGRAVVSGAVALRGGSEERLDVDVSGLPAGTYVVRVVGESFAETRRLTVVR